MSKYNKENKKNEDIFTNNRFQNKNDINIQHLLSYYKNYELKEELLYIKNQNEEDCIISKESQKPDLYEINYVFNKNKCFYGANIEENNPFPRTILSLKLSTSSSDSKEENSGTSDGTSSSKKSEDNSSDKSNESEVSSDDEEEERDEQQQANNSNNNGNDIITSEEIFKNLNNMNVELMNSLVIGGNDKKPKKHDFFNFLDYIEEKGWRISINGRETLHQYFTTLEVFEMLTDAIKQNTSLDSLIIYDEKYKKHFQGGGMYFALKIFLEKYIEAERIHAAQINLLRNITHNNFCLGINNNYCQNQNNYEQQYYEQINYLINGQNTYANNNNGFGVTG